MDSDDKVYNLKMEISYFIVPKLKSYIDFVESGEMMSIPKWVQPDNNSLNEKQIIEKWLSILKSIYIPFHYYVDPLHYQNIGFQDLEKKRKLGLTLFATYFEHLWD